MTYGDIDRSVYNDVIILDIGIVQRLITGMDTVKLSVEYSTAPSINFQETKVKVNLIDLQYSVFCA
jgi:hypothetical protein